MKASAAAAERKEKKSGQLREATRASAMDTAQEQRQEVEEKKEEDKAFETRLLHPRAKAIADRSSPWTTPCDAEVAALMDRATAGADRSSIVFLADGSGSVTDDDFDAMKVFLRQAVGHATAARTPSLALIQFTNIEGDGLYCVASLST